MAVFQYKATDADASALSGTIAADTPRLARDMLRQRGLAVTEISLTKRAHRWPPRIRRRRYGAEVVSFIRELGTLLTAGIPLLEALETLSLQYPKRFRIIVQGLSEQVAAGLSLAEAMAEYPECFDELCVSIVNVGENTGSLESSLRRLADFKEKAHRLRSRVMTALLYPAVVCVIGLVVAVFLMTYVVPNLLSVLIESGRELPLITRTVKAMSDLLLNWWHLMAAAVIAGVLALRTILHRPRPRRAMDALLLRLPLLGDLIRKENTSRIAVVMAALLRSGVQFVPALRITRKTVRNTMFLAALDRYEQAVAAGGDVARPLKDAGVFSPMVVQMLAVGQKSGHLEEMLEQLAEAYDTQVDTATHRLTAALEPLLIVVLAILVGFIVFATILPILEASNVL